MSVEIRIGDSRELIKAMPDQSVHCVVTSPPYFGLRDYGVDGQMGLEETPAEFVKGMVDLFRDVRRVLRDDGTLWLNLGDSYSGSGKGVWNVPDERKSSVKETYKPSTNPTKTVTGLKPKDLIGIPWRVAFALQEDGWYLRQDIIWHKPNPMPESVQDRCTKAHEYLFLMTKSPRYYFEAAAISEPIVRGDAGSQFNVGKTGEHQLGRSSDKPRLKGNRKTFRGGGVYTGGQSFDNDANVENDSIGNEPNESGMRNKRSVWTVATAPFKEAHFATFPPALIEPCILAGCPAGGTVLDPFGGAGPTGRVADRHGRDAILFELNPAYADIARNRIRDDAGLFGVVA